MAELDKLYLKVLYNGKNITADLSKSLTSFTYTDNMEEADTLDIEVEDSEQKWQNEWYPEKGAKIEAEIGIEGDEVLNCGTFEIDEIEFRGAPDSVNIRCIAAGFKTGAKRTEKNHVHENKTLSEIVRTIAQDAGLEVVGKVSDIRVGRLVQQRKNNLRQLKKLATQYGYTFNVRDKKAIFIKNTELEKKESVEIYDKTELLNFSLADKSTGTYQSASIRYHNPMTGNVVKHTEQEGGLQNTDDTLELPFTAESEAQAIEMTKSALAKANKMQQSGSISLPGSSLLVSGNVIGLRRLGRLSGDYVIKSSSHSITNSEGWVVDAEVYKVGYVEDVEKQTTSNTQKPKKKKGKKKKEKGNLSFDFKGDF